MTSIPTPSTSTLSPTVSTSPTDIEGEPIGGGAIAGIITAGIIIGAITIPVILFGIYYFKRKKSLTTESAVVGQQFISVRNEAYGVVQSSTDVVTNVAYGCIQPSVPGEYEVVNRPPEYEEVNIR
jgi:hypothetical protein